jgi:hypothetical protein
MKLDRRPTAEACCWALPIAQVRETERRGSILTGELEQRRLLKEALPEQPGE